MSKRSAAPMIPDGMIVKFYPERFPAMTAAQDLTQEVTFRKDCLIYALSGDSIGGAIQGTTASFQIELRYSDQDPITVGLVRASCVLGSAEFPNFLPRQGWIYMTAGSTLAVRILNDFGGLAADVHVLFWVFEPGAHVGEV